MFTNYQLKSGNPESWNPFQSQHLRPNFGHFTSNVFHRLEPAPTFASNSKLKKTNQTGPISRIDPFLFLSFFLSFFLFLFLDCDTSTRLMESLLIHSLAGPQRALHPGAARRRRTEALQCGTAATADRG